MRISSGSHESEMSIFYNKVKNCCILDDIAIMNGTVILVVIQPDIRAGFPSLPFVLESVAEFLQFLPNFLLPEYPYQRLSAPDYQTHLVLCSLIIIFFYSGSAWRSLLRFPP